MFSDDERRDIDAAFSTAKGIKEQIDTIKADEKMLAELSGFDAGYSPDSPAKFASLPSAVQQPKGTVGERFANNAAIKSWMNEVAPTGQVPKSARVQSPAVQFGGMKDIISTGTGWTTQSLGIADTAAVTTDNVLRSLVSSGTTDADLIEYVRIGSWTNNAAVVPEAAGVQPFATGAGQVEGLKPQSNLVLDPTTAKVVTIAHWLPITKRALSSPAQVASIIDSYLRAGLDEELENEIANGSGTGDHFEGILNTSGTTAQPWVTDILTTTREAKTKVRTVGHSTPTAFVFNPQDNEKFDLLKNTSGEFYFGPPTSASVQTLWGVPRYESEAIPAGTGVVADWRQAMLWDREQASIQFSDSHEDFFVRNLVAALAELRAGFSVIRPSAFVEIDLTA